MQALKKNPILFVEENQDGTTGGSHYCLLEWIKAIDRERFEVHVIFYESNRMIRQFEGYANVQIFNKLPTINLVAKFRVSHVGWVRKAALLAKPIQFVINIIRTNYWVRSLLRQSSRSCVPCDRCWSGTLERDDHGNNLKNLRPSRMTCSKLLAIVLMTVGSCSR